MNSNTRKALTVVGVLVVGQVLFGVLYWPYQLVRGFRDGRRERIAADAKTDALVGSVEKALEAWRASQPPFELGPEVTASMERVKATMRESLDRTLASAGMPPVDETMSLSRAAQVLQDAAEKGAAIDEQIDALEALYDARIEILTKKSTVAKTTPEDAAELVRIDSEIDALESQGVSLRTRPGYENIRFFDVANDEHAVVAERLEEEKAYVLRELRKRLDQTQDPSALWLLNAAIADVESNSAEGLQVAMKALGLPVTDGFDVTTDDATPTV